MAFVDRDLICKDCGAEFTFSAAEQLSFTTSNLRTTRNAVGNAERGATVGRECRFALRLRQRVRSAGRGRRFPSRPIKAVPYHRKLTPQRSVSTSLRQVA